MYKAKKNLLADLIEHFVLFCVDIVLCGRRRIEHDWPIHFRGPFKRANTCQLLKGLLLLLLLLLLLKPIPRSVQSL